MNYEDMTDFEISKAVKSILISKHKKGSDFDKFFLELLKGSNPDYCNDPSEAWSIILENKISIVFDEHEVYVNQGAIESYPWVKHERQVKEGENPLRAAMIVYLMMQDEL